MKKKSGLFATLAVAASVFMAALPASAGYYTSYLSLNSYTNFASSGYIPGYTADLTISSYNSSGSISWYVYDKNNQLLDSGYLDPANNPGDAFYQDYFNISHLGPNQGFRLELQCNGNYNCAAEAVFEVYSMD